MMKELVAAIIFNVACGGSMYVGLQLTKENYKRVYAFPLMAVTGILMTIAVSFKSLFVLGIVLALYIVFLIIVNPEPAGVWMLPAVWLSAYGWYFGTINHSPVLHAILFGAVAVLAMICPFLLPIVKEHSGENADRDSLIVSRNKCLVWSGLVIGLAACLLFIVIQ